MKHIAYLEDLLKQPAARSTASSATTWSTVKKDYGDERRTQIVDAGAEDINEEDLIAHQEIVVTLSHARVREAAAARDVPPAAARRQGHHRHGDARGRRGPRASSSATRTTTCCSSPSAGRVFTSSAYDLPDAKRQAKGIPLVNVIDSEPGETDHGARDDPRLRQGLHGHGDGAWARSRRRRSSDFKEVRTQRQDRDGPREGRRVRRRQARARERRGRDDHVERAGDPVPGVAGCVRPRGRPAVCAASSSTRAARSSRWRS